jgi:hypothetical protein
VQGFFIGDLELAPGAFGAEYGRATGALVRVDSSPLRGDRWHGVASADLLDTSVAVSRPLGPRVRAAVGLRYGYLAQLLGVVTDRDLSAFLSVPAYGDYQARLEYRPTSTSEWTLFALGSADRLARAPAPDEDPSRARSYLETTDFHRVLGRWSGSAGSARTVVTPWFGVDRRTRNEHLGAARTAQDTETWLGGLRAVWTRTVTPRVTVRAGADSEVSVSTTGRSGSQLRPLRDGDVGAYGQAPPGDSRADQWTVRMAAAAPWVELALLFGRLTLTPGMRMELSVVESSRALPPVGDTPPRGLANVYLSPEPRMTAVYRLTPRFQLKAAGGRYSTLPNPEDLSSVFGNPALPGRGAWHAVAGVQLDLGTAITTEAVVFYRAEDGVPVRASASPALGEALVHVGTTASYGGQVTVRHRPVGRFLGWLTYTLLRSLIHDPRSPDGRLADYDQTHLLTAVASLDLGRGWTLGARARLATGLPRTPVVGRSFDALTGDWQPVFGPLNSVRLPTFFSLDARVDKQFQVGTLTLTVFADVLNVLNRPAAEEFWYDPTYQERRYITGLPVLADLGVRGAW